MLILEAANHDPIRAKEIYEGVDQEWWERWKLDRNERVKRDNKAQEDNGE